MPWILTGLVKVAKFQSGPSGVIHGYSLPPSLQTPVVSELAAEGSLEARMNALEYEMIVESLELYHGNMTEAASPAGPGQGGAGDEDRRKPILRAIADCRAVFAARIGEGPRRRLKDAAVAPVDAFAHEPVVASLLSWAQGGVDPQPA